MTFSERHCEKDVIKRPFEKKTRGEKDVPSMDSIDFLIAFPMFFF